MPSSLSKPRTGAAERDLIESLRARVARSSPNPGSRALQLGIGDDCAILAPPRGQEILVTTDLSLESIHFRRDLHSPESVGHRCLARGLSDLAAMGAQPVAAFLSLALPPDLLRSRRYQASWRDRFLDGLLALAARYRVTLAGGDTAQSPSHPGPEPDGWALADIVLVGSAPRGRALLRSGARAGDRIYVTGHLGGAAAELAQLTAAPRRFRQVTISRPVDPNPHPHLFPQPRLTVGAWLLKNRRASAAIDISDGLSTDLDHLCQESNLSATIDAAAIPIHPLAQTLPRAESLALALHGGEDYELLFTASPGVRISRRIAGVPITCIGAMRRTASRKSRLLLTIESREVPLQPGGWEHYR